MNGPEVVVDPCECILDNQVGRDNDIFRVLDFTFDNGPDSRVFNEQLFLGQHMKWMVKWKWSAYHIIVDFHINVPFFHRFPHTAIVMSIKAFGGTILCLVLGLSSKKLLEKC